MQRRQFKSLLPAVIFLCFTEMTYAETLILKSGKTVEGRIIEKTGKNLKMDFQGVTLTYSLDEVERIETAQQEIVQEKTVPSDKETAMIEEALSALKARNQLASIQSVFPKAPFYEQIVVAFKENFDSDKLKNVLGWYSSPLGLKLQSLRLPPIPINNIPSVLISQKRTALLRQIIELQDDIEMETLKAAFKQSLETTNELLSKDQQMDSKKIEEMVGAYTKAWVEFSRAMLSNYLASLYEIVSDDELTQLVDFLKSEPRQWFDGCWKKGYLRALIPAIKEEARQNNWQVQVFRELKGDFIFPDSQAWYVTYYYRTKETARIIPMLRDVLADQGLPGNSSRASQFSHFFAAVIQGQPGLQAQVEQLKNAYTGPQQEFILRVIKEAGEFHPAGLGSLEEINRLWAEFYAAGDEGIIQNVLSLLDKPEEEVHREFLRGVQVSIVKNALKDSKIRERIKKLSGTADTASRERIDKVLSMIDSFADIAQDCDTRGYNHQMTNKDDDAMRAYESAVTFTPDYPLALTGIAHILYQRHDERKALLYLQAAVYLDPKYDEALYRLGVYYSQQGSSEKALGYFNAALEQNPKNPDFNYALARASQQKGDQANAVKYYRRYLEYVPNGEFSDYARNYLASVGAPAKENIADPYVMLKNGRYDELEQYLGALLKSREKDKDGDSMLHRVYNRITSPPGADNNMMEEVLHLLEGWVEKRPSSHFANTLLGRFYVDYAWLARGTGFSQTITGEGKDLFKDRLIKGQNYLEKAYDLDSSDALVCSELIATAMGLGLEKPEMEKQFQRGIKADSGDYHVYITKLDYLAPKWHGSKEEMFNFARQSAHDAPAHSLIPKVLIDAHWEMYWARWREKDFTYFKNPTVWEEVKNTYKKLLKDFPDSGELHNWFARAAYLAQDYAIAGEQFAVIKDDWNKECWGNFQYFNKVKGEVLSAPARR